MAGIVDRLMAGEEIGYHELLDRFNELETAFEERGFAYIAVNGWLVPALEGDAEAVELLVLRKIVDHLGADFDGAVAWSEREPEDADFICDFSKMHHTPHGGVFVVEAPRAAPA